MKILILGAKGMLGHDLMKVFGAFWPLGLGINDLDITDVKKLTRKLKKLKPDVIINAAAYTDVDAAEKNKKLAQKINGQAVANLARLSLRLGAILIHFSTDYVFSGRKKQGYQESDLPETPLNNYGRSKLIGERQINKLASQGLKYYLIRTSWLFGPASHRHHHKNFVDTILKLAKNRKMIKVVNDQFGSPTYTYDLALAVKNLLINKAPYGIYHLTIQALRLGINLLE